MSLLDAWDCAAGALQIDPMRPVRYGKCLHYIRAMDRGSRLLDVGCGEGEGLLLAQKLGFNKLIGVEVSELRLRRAKSLIRNQVLLMLVSPDNRIPFADGAFDVVLSAAVIEHTLDPEGFVYELSRVVTPGGYLIISSDCWQWHILKLLGIYKSAQPIDRVPFLTQLIKWFRTSNLRIIHFEGFPLPGQEFRFLRLILSAGFMAWAVRLYHRLLRRSGASNVAFLPPPPYRQTDIERFEAAFNEQWHSDIRTRHIAKALFSDEIVFFLQKQ